MRKSQVYPSAFCPYSNLRVHNSSATLITRHNWQHFQTTYKVLPGFSTTVMSQLGCPTLVISVPLGFKH